MLIIDDGLVPLVKALLDNRGGNCIYGEGGRHVSLAGAR